MNTEFVLEKILSALGVDDTAFFNLGVNSRVANFVKDRAQNFYMLGSMGLISSLGLGLALNSQKKVFVFDGDGSLLMDLGIMPLAANSGCSNFFHIVLDNESYCSTGKQPTCLAKTELSNLARACGYNQVLKITDQDSLQKMIADLGKLKGPVFISIKTETSDLNNFPRVKLTPKEITDRFIKINAR